MSAISPRVSTRPTDAENCLSGDSRESYSGISETRRLSQKRRRHNTPPALLPMNRLTRLGMGLIAAVFTIGFEEMVRFHSSEVSPVFSPILAQDWKVNYEYRVNKKNVSLEEAHQLHHERLEKPASKGGSRTGNATEGDKSLILNILKVAGLTEIPEASISQLPTTKVLESMYGRIDEPIFHGLETCEQYRSDVPLAKRVTGPAGMFNTGTNALEVALRKNIKGTGMAWQVPWGKHRTESRRLNHKASGLERINQTAVLPIVIIRDPYSWMQSMCRHPYAAKWVHGKGRCPNLVPSTQDFAKLPRLKGNETTFNLKVPFDNNDVQYWDSLADLWSHWYRDYLDASYPRVMIRFEDLLLHSDDIMETIAECLGTKTSDVHYIQKESSKAHGSGTDFLKAVLKTGDSNLRQSHFSKPDLRYAKTALDTDLIRIFQYQLIEPKDRR